MTAATKARDDYRAKVESVRQTLIRFPFPPQFKVKPADFVYAPASRMTEYTDVVFPITLHYTERFGWVMAVLLISRAGRQSRSDAVDRTYAIGVRDGSMCRVGLGPHVLATLTLYAHAIRAERLAGLLALHKEGEVKAHEKRDTISTRRLNGRGPQFYGMR
jgi:hypothetical protein